MLVTIQVTEEDIKRGIRCGAACCPVAVAGRRILPPNTFFTVCADFANLVKPEDRKEFRKVHRIILEPEVGARIKAYDETGVMEPFTFDLDIPD